MLAKFATLIWTLSVLLSFTIRACPVYLTTALGDSIWSSTRVQVNWGPDCHEKPEWIGVFTEDPSVSNTQPRAKITDVTNSTGSFVTELDVAWHRVEWNRNSGKDYPNGQCVRYFVASFKGAELLTVECFKIRPMWMSKSAHVSDMPLKSLFIPGTHASGAFDNHEKSELITDFAFAQQVDVWSQLVFGIRFLDISIGVKTERENMTESYDYWIVNENMFVTKFVPMLRDVRRFVKMSGEVVILDFRSFPIGFYKRPDRHIEVLRIIEKEIGDLAYRRNSSTDPNFNCYDLTVSEIRRSDKNLLLIYPIEELPYPDSESKILCSTWKTFDLKSMDTSESLDFMRLLFAKKNDSLVQDEGWIFHAVLSLEQGLRRNTKVPSTTIRAKDINPKLSKWLSGPWSLTANVVTVDYFTSTNLIDIAIYANLHKAFTWANKNLTRFEVID